VERDGVLGEGSKGMVEKSDVSVLLETGAISTNIPRGRKSTKPQIPTFIPQLPSFAR
jgi:hypothetical protein